MADVDQLEPLAAAPVVADIATGEPAVCEGDDVQPAHMTAVAGVVELGRPAPDGGVETVRADQCAGRRRESAARKPSRGGCRHGRVKRPANHGVSVRKPSMDKHADNADGKAGVLSAQLVDALFADRDARRPRARQAAEERETPSSCSAMSARIGRRGAGEPGPEDGGARPAGQRDRAAVGRDHGPDDRQPQPGAARRPGPAGVRAREPLEHLVL